MLETEKMGDRIRMLRAKKNQSQSQLADVLGVTQGAVSSWENGGAIAFETAKRIAAYFDVSLDYLSGGDQ